MVTSESASERTRKIEKHARKLKKAKKLAKRARKEKKEKKDRKQSKKLKKRAKAKKKESALLKIKSKSTASSSGGTGGSAVGGNIAININGDGGGGYIPRNSSKVPASDKPRKAGEKLEKGTGRAAKVKVKRKGKYDNFKPSGGPEIEMKMPPRAPKKKSPKKDKPRGGKADGIAPEVQMEIPAAVATRATKKRGRSTAATVLPVTAGAVASTTSAPVPRRIPPATVVVPAPAPAPVAVPAPVPRRIPPASTPVAVPAPVTTMVVPAPAPVAVPAPVTTMVVPSLPHSNVVPSLPHSNAVAPAFRFTGPAFGAARSAAARLAAAAPEVQMEIPAPVTAMVVPALPQSNNRHLNITPPGITPVTGGPTERIVDNGLPVTTITRAGGMAGRVSRLQRADRLAARQVQMKQDKAKMKQDKQIKELISMGVLQPGNYIGPRVLTNALNTQGASGDTRLQIGPLPPATIAGGPVAVPRRIPPADTSFALNKKMVEDDDVKMNQLQDREKKMGDDDDLMEQLEERARQEDRKLISGKGFEPQGKEKKQRKYTDDSMQSSSAEKRKYDDSMQSSSVEIPTLENSLSNLVVEENNQYDNDNFDNRSMVPYGAPIRVEPPPAKRVMYENENDNMDVDD